jgi:hypothetical protein
VTWGATQSLTWEWWYTYVTEAYVVIPQVFVEVDHGPVLNLDITTLQKDLSLV